MKFKHLLFTLTLVPFFLLSGCAALGTAISHSDLKTQILMSKSIFLDPIPNSEKTVFIQVRNTTDKPSFQIKEELASALASKGYRIRSNPHSAHYMVQVDLLQVGMVSKTAAQEMMRSGYGGALEGAAAGALVTADAGGDPIAGGIVGGVADTIISNVVKDVTFSSIADVKITEKKPHTKLGYKTYGTRILSTADQVNLKFIQAQPKLQHDLAMSISGIF